MQTITHIQEQKYKSAKIMSSVLSMLQWSEQDYAEFKYQRGIEYLCWYMPANKEGIEILLSNKLFWNWWKACWDLRDEVFVQSFTSEEDKAISLRRLVYIYEGNHDPRKLVLEIYPSKAVLIDAFKHKKPLTLREVKL